MRINVSPFRFAVCALGALCLCGAPAFGQRLERGVEQETFHSATTTESSNVSTTDHAKLPPQHAVHDWTHNHMLYPRVGSTANLTAVQDDPRAIQHWQEGFREDYRRWREGEGQGEGEGEGSHRHHHNRTAFHRDWAISIGAGAQVDNAVYPAKWTFDTNETVTATSCTGTLPATLPDYLVVPVDANGTGSGGAAVGQPDIVGLDNLYSGTAPGPIGTCNRSIPPAGDDGVSATVLFSYAIVADGGNVTTSPTTSLDGNLIAFVEQGITNAHFHVLAWKAGDGVNAGGAQDALTGVAATITTFSGTAPGPQSGAVTDLALSGGTDTFSAPFVDYTNDIAYVGDDAGDIYRIRNVFCPTWNPCGGAAPSLDPTWGTAGVLTIGGSCTALTSTVTGVVIDRLTGNIFAGCNDGNLYGFTPTGVPVTNSPLAIGDSSATGILVDPPVIDVVNGWVYEETDSCVVTLSGCTTINAPTGGLPVLVQASTSNLGNFSVASLSASTADNNGGFSLHAPAFNNAYFNGGGTPLLYEYANDSTLGAPETVLYGIPFTGVNNLMTSGTPADALALTLLPAPGVFEISPVTEFFSPGVSEDRIFASPINEPAGSFTAVSFNVNTFPASSTPENAAVEGTGTSAIIIDNTSTSAQANSIYFGTLGTGVGVTNPNSIVKLTQGGLN